MAPRAPAVFIGGRRRLDVIDRARRPLTVIVAPAGSGKTATLALWAASRPTPPLWLDAKRREDRSALVELATHGHHERIVVVDDAHALGSAELEELVDAVRRQDLQVVLASRRDLPLPVVALELSAHLSVLRGDHLRLTPAETTALVRAHAPDADREDVAAVAGRANGWAAAVVLAAHALSSAADRGTARAALVATDQPVLDYLLDEVFVALSASTRHLLLCTAHEERVTETSAHVLSGDGEAGARLAQLAVEGMFVTRYDDAARAEPVWVYHPLLVELLHREVAQGMPDAVLVAAAHARAARHYDAVGDAVQALQHAVASAQDGLVGDLLVRLGPRLLDSGDQPAVREALEAIPIALRVGSRAVSAVEALERQTAGDAEGVLRIAGALSAPPDEPGGASAPLAALTRADEAQVRLWLTRTGMGDVREAAADADRLLAEESKARDGGALDATRTARLCAELAYAHLVIGDLDRASERAQQAAVLSRAATTPLVRAAAATVNAVLELLSGRPQSAAAEARSALETARELTQDPSTRQPARRCDEAALHAVLGWAAWYALDRFESRRQLDLARERLAPGTDPVAAGLVRHLGALALADEGDLPLARRVVASDAGLTMVPPFLRAIHELVRGQLALAAGDPASARAGARGVRAQGWDAEARVLEAAIELAAGNRDRALDLTAQLPGLAGTGAPRADACAAAATVLEFVLHLPAAPGETAGDDAGEQLRNVLSGCAPQRLTRLLLAGLGHPAFLPLLREQAVAGDVIPFAAEALRALGSWPSPAAGTAAAQGVDGAGLPRRLAGPPTPRRPSLGPGSGVAPPVQLMPPVQAVVPVAPRRAETDVAFRAPVPPLTTREAEVLGRLARGDSYVDIAQNLYITQNTVKTHVASLYRKLNAGRRSQALRTAWALGLLTEVSVSPDPGDARPG